MKKVCLRWLTNTKQHNNGRVKKNTQEFMNTDPFAYYDIGGQWLVYAADFIQHSFLFLAIKSFLLVYVIVLTMDLILLLWLRGVKGDLQVMLHGTNRPLISKSKMIIRWEKILERLESGNPSQYKVAVLEAEALAEEILSGIGWKGENMDVRLAAVTDAQLESRPGLLTAHQVRNAIIQNREYQISREEALSTLDRYKRFFDEVELF